MKISINNFLFHVILPCLIISRWSPWLAQSMLIVDQQDKLKGQKNSICSSVSSGGWLHIRHW
jgi:hypothetical protein